MCRTETHIKLCTCGGEVPEESWWQLFRPSEDDHITVVGSFMPVEVPIEAALLKTKIASDLNQYDCFDFEYTPQAGDILKIIVGGQILTYRFDRFLYSSSGEEEWGATDGWGLILYEPLHQGQVEVTKEAS